MADQRKALDYLSHKSIRLTEEQRQHVTELIVRSLITRITDIAWEDAVDYAVKTVKVQYPKPLRPPAPLGLSVGRKPDGSLAVRRG